jgi:carbon-monoxide dehydrogenase iron sulfur subunit
MAKRITIRIERCLGCHTCELACAIAHSESKDIEAMMLAGEKPGYRIHVESYGPRSIPLNCQHCEEPACALACPTGAVHRKAPGKPVLFDEERCIGCSMCVQACPFGAITMSSQGKGILKCDLCIQRLAQGLEPACVSSCPTHALVFEEQQKSTGDKRKLAAQRLAAALEAGEAEEE